MPRYKVALIGTGGIARAHVAALRAHADRVELVAAADVDARRVRAFCAQHAIPHAFAAAADMLAQAQPDIVHVCTPPGSHAALSVQAMEAGAWVLCEKPLCASLAEMDRIEAAERATGQYCSSVFQWRFGSGGQHLKRLIQDRTMGKLLVANVLTAWYRGDPYFAVKWRGTWQAAIGGCTVIHGIHIMDFLLWLMGEWQEIRAMMGNLEYDIEVENVSMASVRFADGAMANITNSLLSPRQESYLRLDFARATVEMKSLYSYQNQDWRFSAYPDAPHQAELAAWSALPEPVPASHATQVGTLLDCLEQGVRPPVSGADVRGTIEFLTAFYKSAQLGEPVTRGSIPPDDPYYRLLNGRGSP